MGRICRICGRERPHERFGGKGMRAVVCRDCRAAGKAQVRRERERAWLAGLPRQQHISAGNLERLRRLAAGDDPGLAASAAACLALAAVAPRRKGRRRHLATAAPELLALARRIGWDDADRWRPGRDVDPRLPAAADTLATGRSDAGRPPIVGRTIMQCPNCQLDLPEGARRCLRCEAAVDELALDEETVRQVLGGLDPEVFGQIAELVESSDDAESFVDAIFLGDCPACGSEEVATYLDVIDVEDPTIARCFACGHHWCTECGQPLDGPARPCGHWDVCERCGKENCDYLGDATGCRLILEWLARQDR